ncbi:CCNL1 [Cordylochernes scorpioides]|uniref:CCNL1 n=1 Tax=Cordylochernes scorpioides TaxID=51811 RepID=A0ABY6L5R0_9ARAC|nr:CCNL1 [Cordylochernes scorpioides]
MAVSQLNNTPNNIETTPAKPQYGKVIMTLENCILPPEKLITTPSQSDGLDKEAELDLRFLGCEIIQTAGILLKLTQVAMATGQIIFQRFYYCKSFVRHSMEIVAMAAITLASKIEESPRRIRDVINVLHHIKQVRAGKTPQPLILDHNYFTQKTQVIKAERRILKELGFCVHVKHPHKIIVTLLEVLKTNRPNLLQTAWNYMNDSLRSDVFLRHAPEHIACACIYLSARLLQIALPSKPAWFLMFGINETTINEICNTILNLYARKKPDLEQLEKTVEDLRKAQQDAKQKARSTASGTATPVNNNTSTFSPKTNSIKLTVMSPKDKLKESTSPTNHHRKRSRSPSVSPQPRKRRQSESSAGSTSPGSSPSHHRAKTPPRSYKEHRHRHHKHRSPHRSSNGKQRYKDRTSSYYKNSSSTDKKNHYSSKSHKSTKISKERHRHR